MKFKTTKEGDVGEFIVRRTEDNINVPKFKLTWRRLTPVQYENYFRATESAKNVLGELSLHLPYVIIRNEDDFEVVEAFFKSFCLKCV